jgi:hypothetical protein
VDCLAGCTSLLAEKQLHQLPVTTEAWLSSWPFELHALMLALPVRVLPNPCYHEGCQVVLAVYGTLPVDNDNTVLVCLKQNVR